MKLNEVTIVESKFDSTQKLDELNWKDVKRGAGKAFKYAKKGIRAIEKGADAYTSGVRQTGDAVAGAANAIGRAGAETFKQAVARPVSGMWNAGKSVAQGLGQAAKAGYKADVTATGSPSTSNAPIKSTSFAVPGSVTPSYSFAIPNTTKTPASSPAQSNVVDAIDSLDKKTKVAVHKKLEKELYGSRSDAFRRSLSRGAKIKTARTAKMPTAVSESANKDYKVWGQK